MKEIYLDKTSVINTDQLGSGTTIWQFCVVLAGARIGQNCNINSHCFIENDVIIGDNVTVKCGVQLWDGIRIENDVFIGPNTTFTNDRYPRSKQYPDRFMITIVHQGVSIGANSTILPGIEIGEYAMIGAGSVVTKNIPKNTIWYGNPARFMGYICKCGNRISLNQKCENCGLVFTQ
jgi:acetyltransferase-like isoleucine patch superfamily enzyme